MNQTIKLNNGVILPLVGLGTNTYGKVNHDYFGEINHDTKQLEEAIHLGYRLIDTAISYRNESVVGLALKKTNMKREDFILTTKIPGTEDYRKKDDILKAIDQSLKAFSTDYIDIVLIHHPWDQLDEILSVWRILEELVEKGVIKTIGVSNFKEKELSFLFEHATIKPALNQIESHPGFWQDDLIAFSQKLGITVEAWGSLSRVSKESINKLSSIGDKYQKTWAQVILNYQTSRNVIVIPKSHRFEGLKENFEIFDFELTKDEKALISKL